jgi:hypothetical protein
MARNPEDEDGDGPQNVFFAIKPFEKILLYIVTVKAPDHTCIVVL